jgi:DNA-binding MarR family transcriptional regulator
LAIALGRDKGKITRFVDRLEASGLVRRDIDRHDRRFSVITATGKGRQAARTLECVFDNIRTELFVGILESDVLRISQMLPQLHKNAMRMGAHEGVVVGHDRVSEESTTPGKLVEEHDGLILR